jgi:tricarballylate dehydrogenase
MAGSELRFDVVVAGCGAAGLSAAVAAAEAGAKVAVLERAPVEERGGNSRYTEAFMRMKSLDEVAHDFESNLAANAGGHVDPSLVNETARPYKDWPSIVKAMSFTDPELISTFASEAGPSLAWLQGHGVRIADIPFTFLTTSTTRLAPIGGGLAIIEALANKAESLGVSFFYETAARSLKVVAGRVVGLYAAGKNNAEILFHARAVILACGGFEGNQEMLTRYVGPQSIHLRPVARGGYYNKGDALLMALEIGAASSGDFARFHAEPVDPRSGVSEPNIMVFPYGILVNKDGLRFCDEAPGPTDATYEEVTRQIFAQKDGLAYVILDKKIDDVPRWKLAVRTDEPAITGGSIQELAKGMGVPAESLGATVAAFNRACPTAAFDPSAADGRLHTEGLTPRKSNFARPLDTPPFIAYPMISSNVFTFGGLKVNSSSQVLNLDGEPIPGLYAGGEVIGLYFGRYTGATSVLRGIVFGRIGGRAAAQERKPAN